MKANHVELIVAIKPRLESRPIGAFRLICYLKATQGVYPVEVDFFQPTGWCCGTYWPHEIKTDTEVELMPEYTWQCNAAG